MKVFHNQADNLRALVDMGSNGIRFSISDLSPKTARIVPAIFLSRTGISLYDAQFDSHTGKKIPIPPDVIKDIIAALLRFKTICADFNVAQEHIRILATEATRTAINSEAFRGEVKTATGWTVEMLSQAEEGNVGAMGVASSLPDVRGLVMDLGGGSSQITWIIAHEGDIRTSPKVAISFPYGAAAMTKTLADCEKEDDPDAAKAALRDKMKGNFQRAYNELEIPDELVEKAKEEGGFHLYLSGGGFRGWGYLLLSEAQKKGQHYPISIINGFKAHRDDLVNTDKMKKVAREAKRIFRVSDRRRKQVPAVAFLINVLATTSLPHGIKIKTARFCQGGVREGFLFRSLPKRIRSQDPLEVAASVYATESAEHFSELLLNAIPAASGSRVFPGSISVHVMHSLASLLYEHVALNKELSSVAALYSTSTGKLASAHGISHTDRARLALMLDARWNGELPPRELHFQSRLHDLLTPEEVWWCRYVGIVAWLIGEVYPAGIVTNKPGFGLKAQWADDLGKKGKKRGIRLRIVIFNNETDSLMNETLMLEYAKELKKVGKRKNWAGGRDGWGMKVAVQVAKDAT